MKRFLRKALIGLAYVFAVLLVLLLLFYAEEDWRGARDWAACQKELQAKGETLDLRQLVPPGKPEDDLSKFPIFAELYQKFDDYRALGSSKIDPRIRKITAFLKPVAYPDLPKTANYRKGESIDLAAWQKYFRTTPEAHLPAQIGTSARDVLQALSQFDPQLNEVDAAVNHPNAYLPVDYERPFEGYDGAGTAILPIAFILELKAVAHLENHEADLAAKDYLFSFRLSQPLIQGCDIGNYMVVVSNRNIDNSILWEGLHRHEWNGAQLHETEASLASIDLLALAATSLRVDRASAIQNLRILGSDPELLRKSATTSWDANNLLSNTASIRPSGWWGQEESHYALGVQNAIDAIDSSKGTLNPKNFPEFVHLRKFKEMVMIIFNIIYRPISTIGLQRIGSLDDYIAKAETYRRLARLACRLEEYRIAHGQYPDKLDELPDLPAHLNQEVLNEQPLRYQRKGDGYLLYSIGWDQKDDGGVRDAHNDDRKGDWPWPSP